MEEIELTLSGIGQTMLNKIDMIHSFSETLLISFWKRKIIGDNCSELLLIQRRQFEEKILDFAPPTGPLIDSQSNLKWLTNIEQCIQKAQNPDLQPKEAFPWF